jgi:hypothetical protein
MRNQDEFFVNLDCNRKKHLIGFQTLTLDFPKLLEYIPGNHIPSDMVPVLKLSNSAVA